MPSQRRYDCVTPKVSVEARRIIGQQWASVEAIAAALSGAEGLAAAELRRLGTRGARRAAADDDKKVQP
jgi:hypothetical protein